MSNQVLDMVMEPYKKKIINNVHRGDVVECIVKLALGDGWVLMSEKGDPWSAWDCESDDDTPFRIQIRHSCEAQLWRKASAKRTFKFGKAKNRASDVYVYGWNGLTVDDGVNQMDPSQWEFFVVSENDLPRDQGSLVLGERFPSCRFADLKRAIENACPLRSECKAAQEARAKSLELDK